MNGRNEDTGATEMEAIATLFSPPWRGTAGRGRRIMAASRVRAFPEMKTAGLAFIAGLVLSVVTSLLYPGGMLIDPVDQADFPAAIGALSTNGLLAQVMTLLMIVAMLLEAFGLLALFRLVGRQGGFAEAALRFGLVASLFGWGVFILSLGMRHMVIHVINDGVGGGPELAGELQGFAIAVHSVMVEAHFAFLSVYPFASMLLGIGLASRFREVNVFKLDSHGMVVTGAFGLFNIAVIQHIHGVDFGILAVISNSLLLVGAVWFLIIAVGMYQGRSGLVPEESAG